MWLIAASVDLESFRVDLEKMNICKTVVIDICGCFIETVNLVPGVILEAPTTFYQQLFFSFLFLIFPDTGSRVAHAGFERTV